jgi:LmbE family N-acetylglucosaminyl deacetylase
MNLKDKKILVISPHPDDEMISTGGLIAKAINENAKVFVLYISIGKSRQLVTGKTEESTRLKETEDVSKFMGFTYKFQFIGDEFMRIDSLPQKSIIEPIEDIMQEFKPDIVVIPYQYSFDQDHRAIFTAAMTALRPIPRKVRHLVAFVLEFEEPHSWGIGPAFKPNYYVVLNEELLKRKLDGLRFHKTQIRDEPFTRSLENLTRLAQFRGHEIGEDYAEAYRLHRGLIE